MKTTSVRSTAAAWSCCREREGERFPRIVADRRWNGECADGSGEGCGLPVVIFAEEGGSWRPVAHPAEAAFLEATDRLSYEFRDVHVARDTETPFDDAALVLSHWFRDPFGGIDRDVEHLRHHVLEDDGQVSVVEGPWIALSSFSFRRQGFTYLSGSYFATMQVLRPDGQAYEEPWEAGLRIERSAAYDPAAGSFSGWGVHDGRFFVLHGANTLYRVDLPDDLPDAGDTDEALGARLTSGGGTPAVFTAPMVMPDGQRVVIGRQQRYAVPAGPPFPSPDHPETSAFVSPGPGAPWSGTELAVESSGLLRRGRGGERIRAAGMNLYSMDSGQMLVSEDRGVTWKAFDVPVEEYTAWDIRPDGRFVGYRRRAFDLLELELDPDVGDGFDPAPYGALTFGGVSGGPIFGRDGHVWFVNGFNGTMAIARVVDGTPDLETTVDLGAPRRNTYPGVAHITADGDLIVPLYEWELTGDGFDLHDGQFFVLRRDGASGEVTIQELGTLSQFYLNDHRNPGASVVELDDGTLVVGWTEEDDLLITTRAVIATSRDGGLTWSEPHPLRPHGGNGQFFVRMAPEGDGLLAVVTDNGSMSGFLYNSDHRYDIEARPTGGPSQPGPRMEDFVLHLDTVP